MTELLSPAAQAVLDAAFDPWQTTDTPGSIAAAAIRAAADQAAPEPIRGSKDTLLSFFTIRHRLLAIADEIEALDA